MDIPFVATIAPLLEFGINIPLIITVVPLLEFGMDIPLITTVFLVGAFAPYLLWYWL